MAPRLASTGHAQPMAARSGAPAQKHRAPAWPPEPVAKPLSESSQVAWSLRFRLTTGGWILCPRGCCRNRGVAKESYDPATAGDRGRGPNRILGSARIGQAIERQVADVDDPGQPAQPREEVINAVVRAVHLNRKR